MTKQKTLEKFRNFNQLLSLTFDDVDKLSKRELLHSESGRWCLMEILEHLYNVEKQSLKYLEYKLSNGATFKKVGMRQKYNVWLMKIAYKSSRKYTAPEGVRPKSEYKELKTLREDYLKLRKQFYAFLQERKESEFEGAMYKTAYFGRISLYQMLVFFEGHFNRHKRQMDRIQQEKLS